VFRQHQGFGLEPLKDPTFPKGRDSVVGWIVADEPAGETELARAVLSVNLLMLEDPTRWTFFNLLPPHLQRQPSTDAVIDAAVRAGMPLLSYDSDVIMRDGTDRTASSTRNWISSDRVAEAWRPVLGVRVDDRPSQIPAPQRERSALAALLEPGLRGEGALVLHVLGADGVERLGLSGHRRPGRRFQDRAVRVGESPESRSPGHWRSAPAAEERRRGAHAPPAGQGRFEPGEFWVSDIKARDALVGFFDGPDGAAYALVVNKAHGMGKSARDTADTVELTFSDRVGDVEAVSWLDGVPGPISLATGTASLMIAGGTGVLLRAHLTQGASVPNSFPESQAASSPSSPPLRTR